MVDDESAKTPKRVLEIIVAMMMAVITVFRGYTVRMVVGAVLMLAAAVTGIIWIKRSQKKTKPIIMSIVAQCYCAVVLLVINSIKDTPFP